MRSVVWLALGSALLVSACVTMPPPPPNAAPPLTAAEHVGIPGVPHSDVIAASGEPSVANASVAQDEVLLSIPFRYRHTAVLTADVVGFSITVSGVQAPAGAPGYYAGTFGAAGGTLQAPRQMDMWCFLPGESGGERENLCLLRWNPSVAAIAPTRLNPYLWTQFSPATGTFDYVNAPVFERRDVEIPRNLVLEYRFERWTGDGVRLVEYAVGRRTRELVLPAIDGAATLRTIAGDYSITQSDGADRASIVATAPK